jgi:hypothetical protein
MPPTVGGYLNVGEHLPPFGRTHQVLEAERVAGGESAAVAVLVLPLARN